MHAENQTAFQGEEAIARFEQDLVKEGLLSADQLAIAKISKENLGLDLGAVLLKRGFVTEDRLLQFVATRIGIPFISIKDKQLDPEVLHLLPMHVARQHMAVPIERQDNKISVAMANPFNHIALDDIKSHLRSEIIPYLVSATEINEAFEQFSQSDDTDEAKLVTLEVTTVTEMQSEAETRKLQEMALGPKVVAVVNNVLARANTERASDIHIEPSRNKVTIRYRVDGLLRDRGSLAKNMHMPVLSRIKIMAGLDIAERRMPQDGRVRIMLIGKPLDLRVSTCPTQHGEKVVIRLLAKDGIKNIDSLGFNENERKTFSDIITKSHGIFILTGPTGSGKSTTLYTALNRINSSEKNIISIEDPIESELEGINQIPVNLKTGLTFATILRSVLRQDPDVIMVGEIRDPETAQISVSAAITGHMVLTTLHTNTAAGAISRLFNLQVEPFLLSTALKGVMAQRLVRRICQSCKEEVEPNRSHIPHGDEIEKAFHGKGCKTCGYTGYAGRMGIFELAAIDEKIRTLITSQASEDSIIEAFRMMGVKSILQDGLDKVNQGLTSVDEVLRVTQED